MVPEGEHPVIDRPILVGGCRLSSRIVFPPMATRSAEGGLPGPGTVDHYVRIAQNPLVSLIITEHSFVAESGKTDPHQLSFASDAVVEAQRAMAAAIHAARPGCKVFAQLNHAGCRSTTDGLSVEEIHTLERAFARSAARVRGCGYDGVEIHSAHGYLLDQFYSPLTNHRRDRYGSATLDDRLRFLLETIALVRTSVGPAFPLAVRLGGCDYQDGGSTLDDAVEASLQLEHAGVDLIDLSGGLCGYTRPGHTEAGYFGDLSRAVKERVHVPVLVTGGVHTRSQAEALLAEGKADLVGMGRALYGGISG